MKDPKVKEGYDPGDIAQRASIAMRGYLRSLAGLPPEKPESESESELEETETVESETTESVPSNNG